MWFCLVCFGDPPSLFRCCQTPSQIFATVPCGAIPVGACLREAARFISRTRGEVAASGSFFMILSDEARCISRPACCARDMRAALQPNSFTSEAASKGSKVR